MIFAAKRVGFQSECMWWPKKKKKKKVFAYQSVGFWSQKKTKTQMVSPQNGDTRGGLLSSPP